MDLGPLRTLALSINMSAHGVAATVTRPSPDTIPISTRGIWLRPMDDAQPFGTSLKRVAPRRVMVLSRAEVPTLPHGSLIAAPEITGGAVQAWRVDGFEQAADPDHWKAIVMQVQG